MNIDTSNQLNTSNLVEQLNAVFAKMGVKVGTTQSDSSIPTVTTGFDIDELPRLPAPAGPLSLDTMLSAIGNETRRQACRDGIDSLELKGEQQAEINQKELEELKEQIEAMAKKGVADKFLKAFSIIGMVLGAVASVLSIAAGAVTGNPLLIAAGVAGIVMTVDSAMSMATDGKVCIAGAVGAIAKAAGADEQTAQIIGTAVTLALSIATIALNIGGAVKAVSAGASAAKLVTDVLAKTTMVSNIASGINSVAKGGATIVSGVYSYQIAQSQADVKELEAILERIRMAIEMEQEMVQNEMERSNELLEAVDAIVDACNKTQGTVLTMSPSMA